MQFTGLRAKLPKALICDFASDPLAPFDKLLHKSNHSSWPLHSELEGFLESLPPEAIEEAYADTTFVGLYGKSERLARVWITERFLIEESARRRLESLAEPLLPSRMPYTADCLQKIKIDGECMVRLADLAYNNATLAAGEFSFTVCSTTESPNSTYWLLRSFYEQGVAGHVSVRLDPFLWGPSDSFPQTMYKMLVYATPVNWESMSKLREPAHGKMQADKPADKSELTEFCWDPRDDGIHFTCEELPQGSASSLPVPAICTPYMIRPASQSRILTARSESIPARNLKNGTRCISEKRGRSGCEERSSGLMSRSVARPLASSRRPSSYGIATSPRTSVKLSLHDRRKVGTVDRHPA